MFFFQHPAYLWLFPNFIRFFPGFHKTCFFPLRLFFGGGFSLKPYPYSLGEDSSILGTWNAWYMNYITQLYGDYVINHEKIRIPGWLFKSRNNQPHIHLPGSPRPNKEWSLGWYIGLWTSWAKLGRLGLPGPYIVITNINGLVNG